MIKNFVERCELAPGFSIARVLTGLWQIADMERDDRCLDLKAAADAMIPYVDAGFTSFDMADHYGSAEEIAGLFLIKHGSRAQLLTKWVPKPGPASREDVRTAVQRSLDRMQASHLDLLQFHSWNYADPTWLESLFWLQELKQEGVIRYLGLTNVDTVHLRIALNSGIEIVSGDVTLDLNGFGVVGSPSGFGFGIDILGADLKNITVRNGTIRDWGVTAIAGNALESRFDQLRIMDNGASGIEMPASNNTIITRCSLLRNQSYAVLIGGGCVISECVVEGAGAGILTGAILAVARAIGETAPLIVVGAAGFITSDPTGPFSNYTAMPIQIFQWTSLPQEEFRNLAAAAILVLLVLLLTLNAAAVILRNRFSRRA